MKATMKLCTKHHRVLSHLFVTGVLIFAFSQMAFAQTSAEDAAKELANPNTALASLTFKNIYTAYTGELYGADNESGFTTMFQPSLPFPLENGDKVIWRPAVPLIMDMPISESGEGNFGSESGVGDIGFDLLYSTTSDTGRLTGYGLFASLPTATQAKLGKDKWTLGPEVFFGQMSPGSVLGTLVNHQWDVAGSNDVVEDISITTVNIFASILPGGGWNYGSAPIITYDWEAKNWTVPVNFNVGKTVMISNRPWKISIEVNYYIDQADKFGPQWSIGINLTPVVSNVLANWFK
jgi:hypothetical protein